MKVIFNLLLVLLCVIEVKGQWLIEAGVSFNRIKANQWEKVMNAYSFARPWIKDYEVNYPVEAAGFNISFLKEGLEENIDKKLLSGFTFNYILTGGGLGDPVSFYNNLFDVDYMAEYQFKKHFFLKGQGGIGLISSRVKDQGVFYIVNPETGRERFYGYSFNIGASARAYLWLGRHLGIKPIMGLRYYPYSRLAAFPIAIHGTYEPGLKKHTDIFSAFLGGAIVIH